jgi:DNA polymerase III delta prime subunit
MSRRIPLVEKYRPHRITSLVGHSKNKIILSNFVTEPYAFPFLFSGSSAVGKTVAALAMAEELHTKPLHPASEICNYDNLDRLLRECEMVPSFWNGELAKFHFILIDEIDSTTETAQRRLLAKLDASEAITNAIFVFTTNTLKRKIGGKGEGLEARFVSRCMQLEFSTYGMKEEIVKFLADIWAKEGGTGPEPNWPRVVEDRLSNIRDCLNYMDAELLARR